MNKEILEEASIIKSQYEAEYYRESTWDIKKERFWADRYNAFLKEHGLTDKDVAKYMYPASYV